MSEFSPSMELPVHLWLSRWVKCSTFHTGIKQSAGIQQSELRHFNNSGLCERTALVKYMLLLLSLKFSVGAGCCVFNKKDNHLINKKKDTSLYLTLVEACVDGRW